MIRRRYLLIAPVALLALGACGQKRDLRPAADSELPVAPFGAGERPDPEALLEPNAMAAPERSVELRKRSEEREDDPYDLPPE